MKARWRMFGSFLVCLFLVVGVLSPPRAGGVSSSATEVVRAGGPPLRLAVGTFDPVVEAAPVSAPATSSLVADPGDGDGYYLVQFLSLIHI